MQWHVTSVFSAYRGLASINYPGSVGRLANRESGRMDSVQLQLHTLVCLFCNRIISELNQFSVLQGSWPKQKVVDRQSHYNDAVVSQKSSETDYVIVWNDRGKVRRRTHAHTLTADQTYGTAQCETVHQSNCTLTSVSYCNWQTYLR